jgi:hypothetical protein
LYRGGGLHLAVLRGDTMIHAITHHIALFLRYHTPEMIGISMVGLVEIAAAILFLWLVPKK